MPNLMDTLEDAAAEVATWHPGTRGYPDSALNDADLRGGIKKLRARLSELEAEADRRDLID